MPDHKCTHLMPVLSLPFSGLYLRQKGPLLDRSIQFTGAGVTCGGGGGRNLGPAASNKNVKIHTPCSIV